MDKSQNISVIGYASSIAANMRGSEQGPNVILQRLSSLKELSFLQWKTILKNREDAIGIQALPEVARLCEELAKLTYELVQQQKKFLIVGGDHSSAMGTWSGAAAATSPLGLIWFDAHMDSHTPESTESGNIHGMPLAVLLGHGDVNLINIHGPAPKLLPQNVCLVGIRDFEYGEKKLLEQLNVRIFYREEIEKRGLEPVLQEALAIVKNKTRGYGLTIDLDVLDPKEVPGVSTRASNGIQPNEFIKNLKKFKDDTHLLGIEIVEFNPQQDINHRTEQVIIDIIKTIF